MMRHNNLLWKWAICRLLFPLLIFAVGMTKGYAQSFSVGNLNYSINYDGISVTVTGHVNGTNATGGLIIPENVTYGGTTYQVTVIGNNAFNNCSGFSGSLTIPNTVTSIGNSAFRSCSGFNGSLIIGNSVISIGTDAFRFCSGFTGSLTIPNSVITIGTCSFDGCTSFNGTLTLGNSVTEIVVMR